MRQERSGERVSGLQLMHKSLHVAVPFRDCRDFVCISLVVPGLLLEEGIIYFLSLGGM